MRNYTITAFLLFFSIFSAKAQSMDDPLFNPTDIGSLGVGFTENTATTAALRNPVTGKLLVAGVFTKYNQSNALRIVRLFADGQPDDSFTALGVTGGLTTETGLLPAGSGSIKKMIELENGSYLLAGDIAAYGGLFIKRGIIRIQSNGDFDPTFNPGQQGTNGVVSDMLRLPDGKILICGAFTQYNFTTVPSRLMRLNADGTIDATFNIGGAGANLAIFDLDTTSDGKIIAVGSFTSYNGIPVKRIARINADGTLDTSFDPVGGAPNTYISNVKVIGNNKMLIGGAFITYAGATRGRFLRLNEDGNPDNGFQSGTAFNNDVYTIDVESNGKILLGGTFTSYDGNPVKRFARLNTDGSLDNTFNPNGYGPGNVGSSGWISYILPTSAGKYFLGGAIQDIELISYYGAVQILENGLPDPDFNTATGVAGGANTNFNAQTPVVAAVNAMVKQPDGKVIIAGSFTKYNGQPRKFIARLDADGTIDPAFGGGTLVGFDNTINAIALQPDGKILVAGDFLFFGNTRRNNLARLNADGTLDPTFNPVGQTNGRVQNVRAIKLLSGGKILLAGSFVNFNLNNSIKCMVVLNEDGTVDNSFSSAIVSGTVNDVIPTSDGKYVVGGSFLQVTRDGSPVSRSLFRLLADGSFDETFNNGNNTTAQTILSLLLLRDGKILVGGDYTALNGIARDGLARLNADGTLDISLPRIFVPATAGGVQLKPVAMHERADGHYIIAGLIEARVLNILRRWQGVTLVKSTGEISQNVYFSPHYFFGNPTFVNNTDIFSAELRAATFTDDAVTAGGIFAFSGQGKRRNSIARVLISDATLPVSLVDFSARKQGAEVLLQWSTASEQNNRGFEVQRSADGINFSKIGFVAAAGNGTSSSSNSYTYTDVRPLQGNNYYRLLQKDLDGTAEYSKVVLLRFGSESVMSIYPNPIPRQFMVSISTSGTYQINLVDLNGKVIHSNKITLTQNQSVVSLSRGELAAGMYLITVSDLQGNNIGMQKVWVR